MPLIRKKHLILAVAIAAMGFVLTDNRFQFFVLALQYEPTMADFSLRDTTVTNNVSKTDRIAVGVRFVLGFHRPVCV